ncbi:MAG: VWA-like domain-containing protein [Desulfovibrionaceae bacterium]|nr:VWA-like domain-containing protein [Desulfovibrionaceae bacterium]
MDKPSLVTAAEHFHRRGFKPPPLFRYIYKQVYLSTAPRQGYPAKGLARVSQAGSIVFNPKRKALPAEWDYVLAHCLLHLVFGHIVSKPFPSEWAVACDVFTARFLAELKIGKSPAEYPQLPQLTVSNEEQLYEQLVRDGLGQEFLGFGVAGNEPDFEVGNLSARRNQDWTLLFAQGLGQAVEDTVRGVGSGEYGDAGTVPLTEAQKAKQWFISSYPLLGALASSFAVIEDSFVCASLNISVAAVSEELREVYVNSNFRHTEGEYRFIMAHELLHVGLRHRGRRGGRDAYLWNVACDFVINGWLLEMEVGHMPGFGMLYDEEFKGLSVEEVYARVAVDLRRCRKLATLRGVGLGDMLEGGDLSGKQAPSPVVDLDDFCREALMQGLLYHQERQRGFLPAGLIEEIRALAQPPIPWDVDLARWFDSFFAPLEKRRSYARASRRQSATPDIARPSHLPQPDKEDARTFGVVLDTSGSMDRALLARALGAIASYAISRDVPLVRVVFCDAAAYDEGYMPPEDIAWRVRIKGRGGTILQPGVDLLEKAKDFPSQGPLLIITDGECDKLAIRREHAFLIPKGKRLPFFPWGKVFLFSD